MMETGNWELIDGLQRLSTLLEFMGYLRDVDTGLETPPSALVGTKYLPSLQNTVWHLDERIHPVGDGDICALTKADQLAIKRARLGVEILKRPSDVHTKYDLFQRLNSFGSDANAQELRNCLTVMANEQFFAAIEELSQSPDFAGLIQVTETGEKKQRPLELAMRFLVHTFVEYDGKKDIEEFIDDGIIELAENWQEHDLEEIFSATFDLLKRSLGTDALKRYDADRDEFSGRVGLIALEVIAVGIAHNLETIQDLGNSEKFIKDKVKEFWSSNEIDAFSTPGLRGTQRIQRTVPFGANWFRPS